MIFLESYGEVSNVRITVVTPYLHRTNCHPGNRNLTNPEEIEKALALGDFIKRGELGVCSFSIT